MYNRFFESDVTIHSLRRRRKFFRGAAACIGEAVWPSHHLYKYELSCPQEKCGGLGLNGNKLK